MSSVELGLGLVSIGRTWGVRQTTPPSREQSLALLGEAHASGIRFFDTAPAYGASEEILGEALGGERVDRSDTVVATKVGEHWDDESGTTFVDHRYDALMASIDRSFDRLGRIDVLQLHKADPSNVASADVMKALDAAEGRGVAAFGASVSDIETARAACETGRYQFLQFPYNRQVTKLEAIFDLLDAHGMRGMVNRPLAMGALADGVIADHFRFVLDRLKAGVVLSGTSSTIHLRQNIEAFAEACR